jgi:L-rhamnose mutarotase
MSAIYGPTNPSPKAVQESGVRRFVRLVELKPEKEQLYREMHAQVWPEVVAALKRANVHNYSIFLVDICGKECLLSYFEYTGSDSEKDFASIAADPTTRDKWWPITDDCQVRLPGTPEGQQWLPAEMVMHLP